jgi:16S rRNA (guanine527-N7)-methyltransferase
MNDRAKELLVRGAEQLGVLLTAAEQGKFYTLATELKKWGKKINLTAIREDEEIVVKHFLDSLTLLKGIGRHGRLLDVGSGAGFPALPVKIVCHDLHVTTVDAVEKKVIFQRHAARTIGLHGYEALHARGEELAAKHAGEFTVVVSRAFSDLPTFARMALPLLKENGRIVAMKGRGGREEADAARAPLAGLGLTMTQVIEFKLPISGDQRALVIIERIV